MSALDYVVLVGYFVAMAAIGLWAMRRVHGQEDFFMGSRGFGKILQTFASFGAGTGSADPVATARTTFTSGMSGMWSIMTWLFVTPFYWIAGVWYRRMRHITLGDWFVERYESQPLGAAYALFGLFYLMSYTAWLFTGLAVFASPLLGDSLENIEALDHLSQGAAIEYGLVSIIAVVVMVYGLSGGLTAAYWTDLLQGVFIILLSVILIPVGLWQLVVRFGDPNTQGVQDGFRIMHERLPETMFGVVGTTTASEFPPLMIAVVTLMLLTGAVVMPHFIATGGGSAKTETDARAGIVIGNLLKRFCTVGWALTALIILALLADSTELREDPGYAWGVATRDLLPGGLRGLMLACLLAALMGSTDTYMIICAALIVRNLYVPLRPNASERECLFAGRVAGVVMIVGAVLISWSVMDVFAQLQMIWEIPLIFAAPFWVGMYWRGATRTATWLTVAFTTLVFFIIPPLAPQIMPQLRTADYLSSTTDIVETTTVRDAASSDVAQRQAEIEVWESQRDDERGRRPEPLVVGQEFEDVARRGGKPIFWSKDVEAQQAGIEPVAVGEAEEIDAQTTRQVLRYPDDAVLEGQGSLNLMYVVYPMLGVDLQSKTQTTLKALEFPPKIVTPFVLMILISLVTRSAKKETLDRYYAKMRTPVDPSPDRDRALLEHAFARPEHTIRKKLLPGTSLEFQRPTVLDVVGFLLTVAACFGIVFFAAWVAGIGG